MMKYAIKLVKDNTSTILETFDTEADAMAAGTKYRAKFTREQGLISCIRAEFNENNNMIGDRYSLVEAWR